ncbi:hypothetical protein CEXT_569041 [Caerostris extrusa]|uniref:Uncharacterized protein n=1 Tax=Caerostris extrusa TaxID=172846 RepID=A0AAV4Y6Q7_CAEEX|nr:hypothetical protein CEXT_569041 [Caerostris extrusa]
MAKPSFATIAKTVPNKAPKQNKQTRPINKPKYITTIKPVEKEILERLINEFKANDALNASYNISRTVARKPQIICFEVSTDTGETQLVESLRKQFWKKIYQSSSRYKFGRRFLNQTSLSD